MLNSPNIPFVELPYQCFQEARKFLQEDRNQKLEEIRAQREKIERLSDKVVVDEVEKQKKDNRLRSMRRHLEELKILADINDPMIKKKHEDGNGKIEIPDVVYGKNLYNHRRHEQTHLQALGGQEMAITQASHPHAAY